MLRRASIPLAEPVLVSHAATPMITSRRHSTNPESESASDPLWTRCCSPTHSTVALSADDSRYYEKTNAYPICRPSRLGISRVMRLRAPQAVMALQSRLLGGAWLSCSCSRGRLGEEAAASRPPSADCR